MWGRAALLGVSSCLLLASCQSAPRPWLNAYKGCEAVFQSIGPDGSVLHTITCLPEVVAGSITRPGTTAEILIAGPGHVIPTDLQKQG